MSIQAVSIAETLKVFWFEKNLKGNQQAIIESILSKKRHFCNMPTGGKSLCYQLPAIISEGTANIVYTLILDEKPSGFDTWL